MSKMPHRSRFFLVLLVVITTLAAAACSSDDGDAADGDTISVFGAYATQIEEPWDGVIHRALLAEEEAGNITYGFTDDIGYSGDMERILTEVAEQEKPNIVFGDAFGNEDAVRRVAAAYPDIAAEPVWVETTRYVGVIGGAGFDYLAYTSFMRDKEQCETFKANISA